MTTATFAIVTYNVFLSTRTSTTTAPT